MLLGVGLFILKELWNFQIPTLPLTSLKRDAQKICRSWEFLYIHLKIFILTTCQPPTYLQVLNMMNYWIKSIFKDKSSTVLKWACSLCLAVSTCMFTIEFKLRVIRQTANVRQRKILRYQAIKSKWTCCFKTEIHNYSFDARKKIWNENVQRQFCQESSNLPFAVPRNVKLKLPIVICGEKLLFKILSTFKQVGYY